MSPARHVRAFRVVETMSGSTRSSDGLDERRRRLLFRAWHRGMREIDLITGRFADVHIASLSDAEVGEFERLMDVPEPDLLNWVMGAADTPASHDTPLFHRLREFHRGAA
jgi:antitoxin CptB